MLCIMARCDGFLIRLSFLCMSGDMVCVAWLRARVRGVSQFASLSWVLRVSPPHFADSGATRMRKCRASRRTSQCDGIDAQTLCMNFASALSVLLFGANTNTSSSFVAACPDTCFRGLGYGEATFQK